MMFCARLLLFAASALGASYNYNQCDLVNGPFAWSGACNPNQQKGTPIDLCNAKSLPASVPLNAVGYSTPRNLKISNPGNTIYLSVAGTAPANLTAGNLSVIVGQGTQPNAFWALEQIHFHWGRLNLQNEGSEHYIQGNPGVMEGHFVHYNTAAGTSVTTAIASGRSDALLVVGVMFQIGSTDLPIISAIAPLVSGLTQAGTTMSTATQLSDMFDGTGDFYSYAGSLTTPTCLEQVTWIVMKASKSITLNTLNQIKNSAVTNPPATQAEKFQTAATADLISVYGNFRPLQVIGGRTVYSSNGPTAACTTVTPPNFNCNAALLASPGVLTPFALLFSIVILVFRE